MIPLICNSLNTFFFFDCHLFCCCLFFACSLIGTTAEGSHGYTTAIATVVPVVIILAVLFVVIVVAVAVWRRLKCKQRKLDKIVGHASI